MEAIDKDGDDITPLAGQGGNIVWLNWVKPAMDNRLKAPGTIISYLTSFEKFLTFVTSSKYPLEDYDTAREEEGTKVMLVAKHKRSKDGPAILGMNEKMQQLMYTYVNKIRPVVAVEGEQSLFVKETAMASRRAPLADESRNFGPRVAFAGTKGFPTQVCGS